MEEKMARSGVEFHIIQRQETVFRYENSINLFFGLNGSCAVLAGEDRYEVGQEGILVLNPCTLYRVECMEGALLQLMVPEETLRLAGRKKGLDCACYVRDGQGIQPVFGKIRELCASLLYEYLQNKNAVSLSAGGSLVRLLKQLEDFPRGSRNAGGSGARGTRAAAGEKAAAFIEYIDRHWDEDLSLTTLADQVHFSVSYLSRFFQRTLGMNFSAYLRKVRMIHARRMLVSGDHSVTQIAYDCGFHNASVFIESFRQEYSLTPGQFRQQQADRDAARGTDPEAGGQAHDQRSDFSVLLAHMPEQKQDRVRVREEVWEIDCGEAAGGAGPAGKGAASLKKAAEATGISGSVKKSGEAGGKSDFSGKICGTPLWSRLLNIGYARDGLLGPVRDQMERAQREIGFEWFRCHGIFDEDMHIYREYADGSCDYSFAYVDMLFDFVTDLGLRPFVELSFMPPQLAVRQTRIFDRPSVISGCADLEKWKALVRALLEHLAARYGTDALRTWRFATISLSYVRIGCLTLEEYARLYETTWRTVKEFDGQLSFGGAGCFPDLIENEEIGVPWFLQFASDRGCLPDFHSMQFYPCIQTDDTLFMEYTLNQSAAPALLSRDPDYLRDRLDALETLLARYGLEDRQLFLEECNSTLWQRDLSGDTLYKAVWLAKNTVLSAGRAVFGYWLLTDMIEERAGIRSLFHGGYGLCTYNGIPKAGYQALRLLSHMGQEPLASGDGWILTEKTASGKIQKTFTLLIYNYSHYSDINCFRYKQLDQPADAYTVFLPGEERKLYFHLNGLPAGSWRVIRYRLDRDHGSSFDQWLRLQAPPYPGTREIEYLRWNAEPACRMENRLIEEDGACLSLEADLQPLEMELVCLEEA